MNDAELSQASSEYWNNFEDEAPGERVGDPFVVVWEDGSVSARNEAWVSESFDMADAYGEEGVKSVLAIDENGDLVPIRVGEQERINTHEEFPFRYATAPVYAGTKRVGTVTFTDH